MFGLFCDESCKFYIKEEQLAPTIIGLNSFNICDITIIADVPKVNEWMIEFSANSDVVRAVKCHFKDQVIWPSEDEKN